MIAAGLLVVIVAAAQPSPLVVSSKGGFPGWMVGPFKGWAAWLPDGDLLANVLFSALLGVLFAAYGIALACARHLPLRPALTAIVALHVIFVLGPPMPLTDVFNYIDYARLSAVHGLNPYEVVPAAVPTDPSYAFSTWHHLPSVYGQLFTLGVYALTPLGVPGAYWALKLLTGAASLGCLALVWALAGRLGRPQMGALVLVGLNPLVLVYGVGGFHNDFFMLLALLGAIAWLLSGREARAGGAFVAAVGLKTSAAMLLPFALLGATRRRELLLGAAAAGAAVVALTLAAFGFSLPGLGNQSSLATPLGAPNLLGLMLGQGGATEAVRMGTQIALAAVVAWLLVRTARGASWLTMAGWATLAAVLALPWEMPWYVAWVLPLAALADSARLRRAALALSVFFLLSFAPITTYVLGDVCDCWPMDTETGKRNDRDIRQLLR